MAVSGPPRQLALIVPYRLLRKINPSVESVFSPIQKLVISLSLSDIGAGSETGFSNVGSSSSSCDSRGSTLSTRPSMEGRFSTDFLLATDVSFL
jgi:hypothetical protein